jgi:hypothetical protein
MCEPASLAMVALSVGQAGMSIMGQQQNQKAQIAYQQAQAKARNEQIVQNRTMATDAYLQQLNAENLMKSQEEQANAEKGQDIAIATMQAKGTAKAAAADAGVGGASLDNLLFDFNRQESMMLGRLDLNQQFSDQARTSRVTGYGNTFKQRVTSIQPFQPSAVANVDYLSPILGIGKAGFTAAQAGGYFKKVPVGQTDPASTGQFPQANADFFS